MILVGQDQRDNNAWREYAPISTITMTPALVGGRRGQQTIEGVRHYVALIVLA